MNDPMMKRIKDTYRQGMLAFAQKVAKRHGIVGDVVDAWFGPLYQPHQYWKKQAARNYNGYLDRNDNFLEMIEDFPPVVLTVVLADGREIPFPDVTKDLFSFEGIRGEGVDL